MATQFTGDFSMTTLAQIEANIQFSAPKGKEWSQNHMDSANVDIG